MLHTTRAVVLRSIRHGDSTVIVKAFTEQLGVRSLLVRTGKRKGVAAAALQPLSRVEVIADEKEDRDLIMVRELRVQRPYLALSFDPVRASLALFVQEVLYKVLRGEAPDQELYAFVEEALEAMDTASDIRNFPLVFLVQLSGHLGFRPSSPMSGEDRFDLREGEFVRGGALHGHTLGPPLSMHLVALLSVDFSALPGPLIPATQRRELLDHMLLYFRMHVDGLGELRSPAILQQVLG